MGFAWTDDPLVANTTPIKAKHATELRTNIDADLVAVGEAKYSWTDTITANSTVIKAKHFSEMQTALDKAYDSNHCNTYNSAVESSHMGTPHYSSNNNAVYGSHDTAVETSHRGTHYKSHMGTPHYSVHATTNNVSDMKAPYCLGQA